MIHTLFQLLKNQARRIREIRPKLDEVSASVAKEAVFVTLLKKFL